MSYNDEILDLKREDWGENVRMITVNLDEDKQQAIARAEEEGW